MLGMVFLHESCNSSWLSAALEKIPTFYADGQEQITS